MTRRERLERRIEKRQQWAASAEAKAEREYKTSQSLVEGIPMGQPILVGHHSEKRHRRTLDRSWNALGRSVEQTRKAEMHESKAANLESALDRTIFSDDTNAVEALEARIAEREAEREHMKVINKLFKKADIEGLKALGVDYEELRTRLAALGSYFGQAPHMPFELQNIGQRIQGDKKRLESIKAQQKRTAKAEASENGVTVEQCGEGYCRVIFAEKPDRSILNALKAAGFYWGRGSWAGKSDKLPACVAELVAPKASPEPGPIIVKGAPCDKWEEVQSIQHEPFIYIMSNGSKWAGEEPDDVAELLQVLGNHALEFERFHHSFYSANPCHWAHNENYTPENGQPRYIDGARMYQCDGVFRFFGNFLEVSHVFHIDTNHKPTINALVSAIEQNRERYAAEKG